jgi:hypothetical protein
MAHSFDVYLRRAIGNPRFRTLKSKYGVLMLAEHRWVIVELDWIVRARCGGG